MKKEGCILRRIPLPFLTNSKRRQRPGKCRIPRVKHHHQSTEIEETALLLLSRKQPVGPQTIGHKALTEYEINAFLGKYAVVQHDEYVTGSFTAKSKRKGDPIPGIAQECLSILEDCFGFVEKEFRDLVERNATYPATEYALGSKTTVIHEKGEIIPDKIPSLLEKYCGRGDSPRKNEEIFKTPSDTPERMYSTDYGYRNPQTGDKWHKNYNRLFNSATGESMIMTSYGYYNSKTGEKWHTTNYGLIKSGDN